MNDAAESNLEAQLRELTRWPGPAPQLWKRALADSAAGDGGRGRTLTPRRRWIVGLTLGSAAVVGLTFVLSALRVATRPASEASAPTGAGAATRTDALRLSYSTGTPNQFLSPSSGTPEYTVSNSGGFENDNQEWFPAAGVEPRPARTEANGRDEARGEVSEMPPAAAVDQSTGDRLVVRKATLELYAADVRTTFRRVQMVISEAQGEYVEDCSLAGQGKATSGWVTLRVAAGRLPAVLTELRELGEVRGERVTGEDVTAQAVDLDARLRNEQRVEAELLDLLAKREDAPLKDVLELRTALARVRESIEQLTAQRERLGRLVSLATLLVVLYPADAPPAPPTPGLGAYFKQAAGRAWETGLRLLADSIGGLLWLFVGGAIWWVLLVIVVLVVVMRGRAKRRAGQSAG